MVLTTSSDLASLANLACIVLIVSYTWFVCSIVRGVSGLLGRNRSENAFQMFVFCVHSDSLKKNSSLKEFIFPRVSEQLLLVSVMWSRNQRNSRLRGLTSVLFRWSPSGTHLKHSPDFSSKKSVNFLLASRGFYVVVHFVRFEPFPRQEVSWEQGRAVSVRQ